MRFGGRMKRAFIFFIFIFVALTHCVKAQFLFIGEQNQITRNRPEANQLLFNIRSYCFFVDNEYKGEKTFGYTLPGFRLTPTLSFGISDKVSMEAGVSLLNYHGANKYPCSIYSFFPTWLGYQYLEGVHAVPYFKVDWHINSDWNLSFGNIDNHDSHLLPEPLYNVEHCFASDPENGLQLKMNKPFHKMDIWLNWQSFVFKNDIHQEAFSIGYNSQSFLDIKQDKFRMVMPISFLAQHLGGENLSGSFSIQTWLNMAVGLKAEARFGSINTALGADYLFYKQIGSGSLMPFDEGWALYPYFEFAYDDLRIKLGYYDSEDFVSLLGSPHFCNYSSNTPDLVFDRANQYYLRATYRYDITKGCKFDVYLQIFKQNHITGDRPGFPKVIRDGFVSFSFGVILSIDHSILLKRFSSINESMFE